MFTYNEKGAADQMRNTLKQIVKHTGTIYGQDISNELHNMRVVVIAMSFPYGTCVLDNLFEGISHLVCCSFLIVGEHMFS